MLATQSDAISRTTPSSGRADRRLGRLEPPPPPELDRRGAPLRSSAYSPISRRGPGRLGVETALTGGYGECGNSSTDPTATFGLTGFAEVRARPVLGLGAPLWGKPASGQAVKGRVRMVVEAGLVMGLLMLLVLVSIF